MGCGGPTQAARCTSPSPQRRGAPARLMFTRHTRLLLTRNTRNHRFFGIFLLPQSHVHLPGTGIKVRARATTHQAPSGTRTRGRPSGHPPLLCEGGGLLNRGSGTRFTFAPPPFVCVPGGATPPDEWKWGRNGLCAGFVWPSSHICAEVSSWLGLCVALVPAICVYAGWHRAAPSRPWSLPPFFEGAGGGLPGRHSRRGARHPSF